MRLSRGSSTFQDAWSLLSFAAISVEDMRAQCAYRWAIISIDDLVAYPVYQFLRVTRQGSSNTEGRWFLRAQSTVLYSPYSRCCSACSLRIRFSSVVGVHAGTCTVQPGSGRRMKEVPETREFYSGGRMRPRQPLWPPPRLYSMDAAFAVRSWQVSLMAAQSSFPECLGSQGVGNPSMVASTAATFGMASTPTVEVIRTCLVARKREGVFCRKTLALEYESCHKAYSTQLLPYVTFGLSVSARNSSVCRRSRPFPYVVLILVWGGD